jgi:hypothetical protein
MPENFFIRCVAAPDTPASSAAIAHATVADGSAGTTITSIINSLPSTGGIVFLLPGTFVLGNPATDKISIAKSNVALLGSGPRTVICTHTVSASSKLIYVGNNTNPFSNIVIKNLSVTDDLITYPLLMNYAVFVSKYISRLAVLNNIFSVSMGGCYIDETVQHFCITNNFFDSCGDESIQLSTLSKGATFDGLIQNNKITLNGQRTPQAALRLYSCTRLTITGNTIQTSVKQAASFGGNCKDVIFANNILLNNASDSTGPEVTVTTGISGLIMSSNIINTTAGTYCIQESNSACVDCVYTNNVLAGGTTARKLILSADSIWEHNQE